MGRMTLKKKYFIENLQCVVQLRVKGDQQWHAISTGMSSSEAYRTILLQLVPRMEIFLLSVEQWWRCWRSPVFWNVMLCPCVNGYRNLKGISPTPPLPPPSVFQDLMPMNSEPLKNEGEMMIICVMLKENTQVWTPIFCASLLILC